MLVVVDLHFIFDLGFVVVIFISFSIFILIFFICRCSLFNICFSASSLHPSVDYRRVFIPILYFQPSSSQGDSRHFHFQLSRYLLAARALHCSFKWAFFTRRHFLRCTTSPQYSYSERFSFKFYHILS